MKKVLLFAITSILFLSGCADFHDEPGKSVWSEGMWIIPLVTGIGAAIFLYQWTTNYMAYKKHKEVKKYKGFGKLIFGVALVVATIVIIIVQIGAR